MEEAADKAVLVEDAAPVEDVIPIHDEQPVPTPPEKSTTPGPSASQVLRKRALEEQDGSGSAPPEDSPSNKKLKLDEPEVVEEMEPGEIRDSLSQDGDDAQNDHEPTVDGPSDDSMGQIQATEIGPTTQQSSANGSKVSDLDSGQIHGEAGLAWKLPLIPDKYLEKKGKWRMKYEHWRDNFHILNPPGPGNPASLATITPALLGAAFESYLYSIPNLSPYSLTLALEARDRFAKKMEDREYLDEQSLRPKPPNPLDDAEPVPMARREMTREEELEHLRAYFPGVDENADFCVRCAKEGHRANQCPLGTCRLCSSSSHTTTQCRQGPRCQKCSEFGHETSACKPVCSLCSLSSHTRIDCPTLWRTYAPRLDQTKKVNSIPTFCYCCGSSQHLGGDCPDNKGKHISGRVFSKGDDLWTGAVRDLYVDHTTDVTAVDFVPPPPPLSELPRHPQQRHIHFTDSDDEEDDGVQFLGARVTRPAAPQIHFSDLASRVNLDRGNASGGGNQQQQQQQPSGSKRRKNKGNGGGNGTGQGGGQNNNRQGGSSLPARPPAGQGHYNNVPPPGQQGQGQSRRGGNQNAQGRGGGGGGGGGHRGGRNLGARGGRPRRGQS